MGDADKGAGLLGPGGELGAAFLRVGGREIEGQAGGHDMPGGAVLDGSAVQFGADDGREPG